MTSLNTQISPMERLYAFRQERLAQIKNHPTVGTPDRSPMLIVHMVPADALEEGNRFDLRNQTATSLPPMTTGGGYNGRYNVEGYISYLQLDHKQKTYASYTQLFRSGVVEAVDCYLLGGGDAAKRLSSGYEQMVVEHVGRCLQALQALGVAPKIYILLSIVGAEGHTFDAFRSAITPSIDRDEALLPEVVIEDFTANLYQVLRPAFDTVWQAAGRERSPNYDQAGIWTGEHARRSP